MPRRAEKTQRGNPHELTVRQHVYPSRSIARFLNGIAVDLFDLARGIRRPARLDDALFCADRAWNHAAEHGFMKDIEDAFQGLVEAIPARAPAGFNDREKEIISEFYGLWEARARRRRLPYQHIKPRGVLGTRVNLTTDDLERLEKHSITGVRPDGSFAMRDMVAPVIRLDVDRMRESLAGRRWGVFTAEAGEFCVPDLPSMGLIPINPTKALALDNESDTISQDEVAGINRAIHSGAREYLFARSLAACPGLPSTTRK